MQIEVDGRVVAIEGLCEPGWEPVRDAFTQNFTQRRELGAAVAVFHRGRPVVDLWGGHLDLARERAWERDSIVTMASVVKGMMAIGVHMLIDQGRIDLDGPVADLWPEFAQAGKGAITVRQLISHHAAVHMIDAARPGDFVRWERMVEAIAAQPPEWAPGTRGVYHTISIVFIFGKLIQCATGQAPWDWFRRDVTEKLGIDYHLRLTDRELSRFGQDFETEHFVRDAAIPPEVMARFFAGMPDATTVFTPEELAAMPYGVSAGNARGVARLFAFCAEGGALDGVRILSPAAIDRMTEEQWHAPCAVWGTPMRMGAGILLNDPAFFSIGPNPAAFGTAGGGGSFGMADREARLSVAYSLNRWWPALSLGDRARTLVDAVYRVV